MTGDPQAAPLAVGVVGYGYWGPKLARNLRASATTEVVAIVDSDASRAGAAREHFPDVAVGAAVEGLFAREEVEALVIATPASSHFELAHAALEAGKHVLVAKPLATTVAEADALLDLAAERELILMVDHTFVYTGAVQAVRDLVRAGRLGEPYYFDSVRTNLGVVAPDANVVWDLAAHDFAILAHLFDAEPLAIRAVGSAHLVDGREDVAYVAVEFAGAFIAHFHLSWLSPVKIRRTTIAGSERMLVWDDTVSQGKVTVFETAGALHDEAVGVRSSPCEGRAWEVAVDGREALAREVDHFARCVRTGEPPLTDGRAGRQVVGLLEAAAASLRGGGEVTALAARVES